MYEWLQALNISVPPTEWMFLTKAFSHPAGPRSDEFITNPFPRSFPRLAWLLPQHPHLSPACTSSLQLLLFPPLFTSGLYLAQILPKLNPPIKHSCFSVPNVEMLSLSLLLHTRWITTINSDSLFYTQPLPCSPVSPSTPCPTSSLTPLIFPFHLFPDLA